MSRNRIKYKAKHEPTTTLWSWDLYKKTGIKALTSSNLVRLNLVFLILLIFGSCSNLRHLEENQQLFTGASIAIESDKMIRNKGEIKAELERVVRPQPNQKFLFWRTRLWFYNIAGEPTGKGLRHLLRNRIGRPPVLFNGVNPDRISRLMENRLFNMGFFDARVEFEVREKNKTAGLDFQILLNTPFEIRNIHPIQSDFPIATEINNSLEHTLVRSGQPYQLNKLKEERERINRHLKELGYFYFHPDFLLFQVDSTVGNRQVDLRLGIKPGTPEAALNPYRISNVFVNITHGFGMSELDVAADTIEIKEGIFLVDYSGEFKLATIVGAVFFNKSDLYNSGDHDLTLNHLMGLGVFNFVNIRFEDVQQYGEHLLDVRIQLTLMDKKSIGAEIRGVSKSTNFVGPGLNASFNNRNTFRGAEQFSLNLDGAFETLIGQRQKSVNSLETGITARLNIPRFVAPGRIKNISPLFIPHTQLNAGFNIQYRTDAFSVISIHSQFGYRWKQSITSQHRLFPFVFNIFSLGTISDEYQRIFSEEVLLRRGLFGQFLLGSEYSYYYNSQLARRSKHDLFFNLNINVAGNMLYLVADNLFAATSGVDGGYGMFGQSFSQYSKVDFDIRYYLNMDHGQRLVTRFMAGLGVPYGNSTVLPYVKSFTSGGSNGLRAFPPRSVGPGAYVPPDTLLSTLNIHQSGEIKLEMNVEYRFSITNIIKGALFADAGNVWNIRERERVPGGKFDSSTFMEQIALGAGVGLRFDVNFFILRLDLAFPLAIPYDSLPGYLQPFEPFKKQWRKENLLLNFAIGYPF